ncbi:hypothetical protein HIM_00848 [Hirsutella minnesotensis 3608]|nr:hypothetical protein HIM_00848 [Hirsutella minnesotensis 3608]
MALAKLSWLATAFVGATALTSSAALASHQRPLSAGVEPQGFKCILPEPVDPSDDGLPSAETLFSSKEALEKQVERHRAVIRVPTVCYDDMGDLDKDPRWKPFQDLHKTLEKQYPAVHKRARLEKVNQLGLVYTIKGSDEKLQPVLLTAHQDVVPIADESAWKHPPFEGHFDGELLWGRGSIDDKGPMTAIMSSLESLLAAGSRWKPRRTVVVAFGFDEECSGQLGAAHISRHLAGRYGNDSFALLYDEGGLGLLPMGDVLYAQTAVFEKGYANVWLDLSLRGGHSSVPRPHTGIGIMAEVVTALEAHPFSPHIASDSPAHRSLQCQAEYSPDAIPGLPEALGRGDLEEAARVVANSSLTSRYLMQTSQAVDIIKGGLKINALPEVVTLGVNYRIAAHDGLPKVQHHVATIAADVVSKYGIGLKAYEGDAEYRRYVAELEPGSRIDRRDEIDYEGTLSIRSPRAFAPTPVTSTDGPFWAAFAGTIRHTYASGNRTVVPIAEGMTANTDTRHYLNLTPNIFRWLPVRLEEFATIHGANEAALMASHMEMVRFYYNLIRVISVKDFDADPKSGPKP